MAFCLIKSKADEFLRKIKSREIDINKLSEMTSDVRRAEFIRILNFDETTAKEVNALFESKLLLKYQKTGIKNWIQKTGNLKPDIKRDLLSRVQRMEKLLNPKEEELFLKDLAEKRLDVGVSREEAENIFNLSKKVEEKKSLIKDDLPIASKERLDYGITLVQFQDYVRNLKLKAQGKSFVEYLKRPQEILYEIGGATKSFLSTLDNSFFGRQGIKTLYTKPYIWIKNFLKSWGDISRVLVGRGFKRVDGMLPIKADIYSRPNALNGRYKKMGLDISIDGEEAFPSSIPEKIPILGRLFQASEVAFNGGAMRMRADLADKFIKIAERQGIDVDNIEQLKGIGLLSNAMTGRGGLGKGEVLSKEVNALMFSVKFLKSNFDTLTMHFFNKGATAFTRKQAIKNLLSIIGSIAGILGTAKIINPDSVDIDPRSSDFGKIKINDTRIDITGGMGSLITLGSRLIPTKHNGEWGFWQKNSTTGKWTDLTAGKYGQRTALDVFEDFIEGKLSPMAGLMRDIWKGQNFDREKVNIQNAIKSLTIPISVQQFEDLMKSGEEGEKILLYMILEGLGFGTLVYK